MGFVVLLTFVAVIGLGLVIFWIASGLNAKYTNLGGAIMQGLIITPFLAVGGVAAFLLFGHMIGVPDVAEVGVKGLTDVLVMVAAAGILGGFFLGLGGFFMSLFFD